MTGNQRSLRLALAVYPKRYRAERGAEIAQVYADTTAGAGPRVRARELYGVAGYGMRMRLGVTSTKAAGRLLGEAAPLIAGAAAGAGLGQLAQLLRWSGWGYFWPHQYLLLAIGLLAVPMLAAVLRGRWTAARVLALVSVAGWVVGMCGQLQDSLPYRHHTGYLPLVVLGVLTLLAYVPPLFWALMLLLTPADLLDRGERRRPALAMMLVVAATTYLQGTRTMFHAERSLSGLTVLTGLAVSLLAAALVGRGRVPVAGVALAWLPLVLTAAVSTLESAERFVLSAAVITGALTLIGGLTVRSWRRLARTSGGTPPA
ncbi:hypothetical protein [Kitasatospora kifunensis]|uniref:Uncharacterized protein n=1 Tax=Kitasatospora kifunensis TaxID=58351 RepID=A0A7W7R2C4_KITKI|nr:hypothetical protein [Kitasatospora kifunensis]MBB4924130.1 hypothetical protein [Kitasatospora kifunensis]